MKFTVVWQPHAEGLLAAIWTQAADRDAVRDAASTLDRELKYDAHRKGEAYSDTTRILTVAPLTVHFEVDEGDRMVKFSPCGCLSDSTTPAVRGDP